MNTILLKAEFVLLYFITATYVSVCVYIQFLSAQELNPCLITLVIILLIIVGSLHSMENKDGLLLSVGTGRECAQVTVCKLLRLKASAQTALTAF